MCLFQLTRIEYYFSYKFLVTSFKKSTSKALRKKGHIDKKKFSGVGLTTPSPPCSRGLEGTSDTLQIFRILRLTFKLALN